MNVKSNTKGEHNTVELIIEVDGQTFQEEVNKVYLKQRKTISVPGFRRGKVPRNMLEKMFGEALFYEDAIQNLYPAAYEEAVKAEGLEPYAYPHIEIVEANKDGFSFKAIVPLKPEVKLGEYKGLTAPKVEVKVSEADIDAEMEPYIKRATRLVSVKRKAKKGDTAVIDFEGFDNGVPFEGGKGEGYSLDLGSGTFVPGFEEGVIGMKAGEEKDLDITFPEQYTPELAGKAVVFKVKVNEVKEHQKPELDDEFAKDVSEFETLADFRKDLEEKIKTRREAQAQTDFERAITDQLINNMEVDLADTIVEQQADRMVQDYAQRITSQGIAFEQYLSMMGMTPADFKAQALDGSRRRVLNELALEAVAKAEGMTISDEEKKDEIKRLAEEYKMEVEAVEAAVPAADLEADLLMKKAAKFVFDNAKAGKAPVKKKAPAKKAAEGEEAAEKPAKKTCAKKTTKKAEEGDTAEKKPAAKKTATKKTTKKTEEEA